MLEGVLGNATAEKAPLYLEQYDQGYALGQTIEVLRSGQIVQCRGRLNALPSPQELEIVRRWAAREGLEIAPFVRGG